MSIEVRSIRTSSSGRRRNKLSDDTPRAKSSRHTRTPRTRSDAKLAAAAVRSSMTAASVTSTVINVGSTPLMSESRGLSRHERSVARGGRFTRKRNPSGSPNVLSRRIMGRACCITLSVMRSSRPASAANCKKSAAGTTTPSRRSHRARSSAPTMAPVVASISGWKNGTMSPSSSARRSACSELTRLSSSVRTEPSKISTRFRPAPLARCNAAFAKRNKSVPLPP